MAVAAAGLAACNYSAGVSTGGSVVSGGGSIGGGTSGGGSSGGGSISPPPLSHSQLAQEFVYALQLDAGFDIELVKTNTRQNNYVVVYDWDFDTYDAYDLTNFNVNSNIFNFLNNNEHRFYYDLIPIGMNEFEDYWTGLIFNITKMESKDHMKLAAFEEALQLKKASDILMVEYGLSVNRSQEVAKLAMLWQNTPKELMTDGDHDRFAQAVLGNSISEYKEAVTKKMSGDGSTLEKLIENAAQVNGVSVDQVHDLVSGSFGISI